jgi:hypothetical protein
VAPGDPRQRLRGQLLLHLDAVTGQRPLRIGARRAAALAALALALTGPTAQAATPPTPALGGFSLRPAHFDAAIPATRSYFIHTVAPGGSFSDAVVVGSSAARATKVEVYAVDGLTATGSGAVYGTHQQPLRGAGRWVHAQRAEVTVPAHGEVSVPFTVRVPADATAGDHLAGIVVEPPHSTRSRGRFSVVEVVRSALAVEIQVPGPVRYATVIAGLEIQRPAATSTPDVVVRLRNSGDKLCRPTLAVSLRAAGAAAQTVRRALNTILPGDTIAYPLAWPRPLAAGSYTASARTSGCGPAATARETISYGRRASSPPASAAARGSGGVKWWEIALIVAVGVAAGAAYTLLRRRGDAR